MSFIPHAGDVLRLTLRSRVRPTLHLASTCAVHSASFTAPPRSSRSSPSSSSSSSTATHLSTRVSSSTPLSQSHFRRDIHTPVSTLLTKHGVTRPRGIFPSRGQHTSGSGSGSGSHGDPPSPPPPTPRRPRRKLVRRLRNLAIALAVLTILYETYSPFRHTVIASVRCARLMQAVILDVLDYKRTFSLESKLGTLDATGTLVLTDAERAQRRAARKACHKRSAERILVALKKNSGIYVKLGQHVAAVQVLPKEWTSTMRPLQDQCTPTPIDEIDAMLRADLSLGLNDLFLDFSPTPIGVASLAQVHTATDRRTNQAVAVKLQHADLAEFAQVDMFTVNFAIHLVKYIFPDFEFGWLGEEMNEMLPIEMDFRHEASNSAKCRSQFADLKGKTSLYLPEVLWAERRCLVMEYIDGSRIDDLAYLKSHNIDRNQVSQELSRIFSRMVYINGFFHADPHHGNLLIRPRAANSTSPFNFDICLLDHGQYFDIPSDLRVNYARFWLSLMARTSKKTVAERKKYAKLVGNIDDDMYPILESAITGRIGVTDIDTAEGADPGRVSSLLDSGAPKHDIDRLRTAVMEREGLILSIFELLRTVPRRLLMILKLSDLQRALDLSLSTTHGQSRVFIIIARYCALAVWQDDLQHFRQRSLSMISITSLVNSWLSYSYYYSILGLVEWSMDVRARWVKMGLWVRGLGKGGLRAAGEEMAGMTVVKAA